ncbi:hypothetical protein FJT64_005515 [Amphibalanus amphitrite]|uniref:Uncharacterized protein n=1 Tax=Amphibalanus amphitrite TaxID=1232801 RepID=A0A6A4VVT4_AMPAM|nr:hypothetical protein FJT64_005515 [Amphibalanus amphitrite]
MKFLYVLAALLVLTQVIQVEALFGLIALKAGAIGYALGRASGGFGGGYGRRRGGYGGYGRQYGRRGGYGHHRYGRDLTAVQQLDETSREGLQMDAYFAAVQLGDEDGCGLRLVCELRTMDPAQLGEEENIILALFGSNVPSSGRPDSPKLAYDAAADLGSRAGSVEVCAETFHACQYGSAELIQAIKDSSPEQ